VRTPVREHDLPDAHVVDSDFIYEFFVYIDSSSTLHRLFIDWIYSAAHLHGRTLVLIHGAYPFVYTVIP
jgi:hypothetical protein